MKYASDNQINPDGENVAKYASLDRVDLIENEEYGYCSLIKATKQVLDKLAIDGIIRKTYKELNIEIIELLKNITNKFQRMFYIKTIF